MPPPSQNKCDPFREYTLKKVFFLVIGPLRGGWGKPLEPLRKKHLFFYDLKKFTRTSRNTRKIRRRKKLILCAGQYRSTEKGYEYIIFSNFNLTEFSY